MSFGYDEMDHYHELDADIEHEESIEAAIAAHDAATAEAHAAATARRCDRCGRESPPGRTADVCETCERSVTFDGGPWEGEQIPW